MEEVVDYIFDFYTTAKKTLHGNTPLTGHVRDVSITAKTLKALKMNDELRFYHHWKVCNPTWYVFWSKYMKKHDFI